LEKNEAPMLATIDPQTVNEEVFSSITNSVNDPDLPANTLTFNLEPGAPEGVTINSTNGVLTWTPLEIQAPSTNIITVRVIDDGSPALSTTNSFTIVVNEVNKTPVLANIYNKLLNQNSLLSFSAVATDSDFPANILSYSLGNAPLGSSINASNGLFTWIPTSAQGNQVYNITVRVTDDGSPNLSDAKNFAVTVNAPPIVSVINPTNGTTFIAGQKVSVVADASDPDGTVDRVEFFEGTNKVAESTSAPFYFVRNYLWTGSIQFSAKATDDHGFATTSSVVTATVLDRPPLIKLSTIYVNAQNGLLEQLVRVTNSTPSSFYAIRIYIYGLKGSERLFNATGTNNGIPYLQYNLPIPSGAFADISLQFYVPSHMTPTLALITELVFPNFPSTPPTTSITRAFFNGEGTLALEFNTSANTIYYVQSSSNLVTWHTVMPHISGTGIMTQWLDNSATPPLGSYGKFFRIVLIP
ncbi:MAG: putative Ig domain-containing protein, partial [Verrucomicrobiota bacterium]